MKRLSLISIILFLTVSAISHAQNDSNSVVREKRNTYTGKAYKAVSIHADIFSPAMGIIGNKNVRTGEIQADINLYYKFFPTLEAGYGSIQTTLQGGQEYRSASPFVRVGFNYNLINNADKDGRMKHIVSYPFVGARYAMSATNYEAANIPMNNDYWAGGDRRQSFSGRDVYCGWLELVGGIRVNLYRGFTMGWSVRLKTAFHTKDKTKIWWNPGYGFTQGGQFAFNYTIGYTLFSKSNNKPAKSK